MKASFVKFNRPSGTDFYQTLKSRVNDYFESKNISRYGNSAMVTKTIALILLYLVPYFLIVTQTASNPWVVFALWIAMGLGMTGVGFNVMHDANHGSYSRHAWINFVLGRLLNLLGGNALNWKIQHNMLHHSFTNIEGLDEDIAPGAVLRFSPHQPWHKHHRFQHIYGWFLYSFLTLLWISDKEFKQAIQWKKDGYIEAQGRTFRGMILELILSKVVYYGLFLVIPLVFAATPWWMTLLFFLAMHLVAGFISSVVFQSAHVIGETEFPLPDEKGYMKETWAVHQLATTCDFAPRNRILSWYIGGLNYQVEHHLFPNICHIHYPAISGIVRSTAREFGVPYHVMPSFRAALWQHGKLLRRFGRNP